MKEKKLYHAAAYLRLSKGDGDVDGMEKAESNSISSQRLIIQHFLEKKPELVLEDSYIDDGYTGTNFDRPELKRMMADIDAGKIDCVIVKDLSRFGRERIQTGQYIAHIFREKDVRFIAITDHYDSLTADGSETHLIMPIKALTNDSYSRDISMKVRSSREIKRENGQCIAAFAPYGYRKDPEDHNHLLIDEDAARVVQGIYHKKLSGMSANAIAGALTESGVLTPSFYKKRSGVRYVGNTGLASGKWTAKQVIRILTNEVYTGCMVQGRQARVSYKVSRIIDRPKADWAVVQGTHEAIISGEDFRLVQSLMSRDCIRQADAPESYLFGGLLFCGDCGCPMVRRVVYRKTENQIYYDCSAYNRAGSCTSHRISEGTLYEAVLKSINHTIARLCRYDDLAAQLAEIDISMEDAVARDRKILHLNEDLVKCRTLKSSLYQDLRDGLITENQYSRYRDMYAEKEQTLQHSIRTQTEIIERLYQEGLSARELIDQFRSNPRVEKLDRMLLVTLIDRILIKESGEIEIYYRIADELNKCDELIACGKVAV